jgi:hypothetical protein
MTRQTLLFTYGLLTSSKRFHNKPTLPSNRMESRQLIAKTIRLARAVPSFIKRHRTKKIEEKAKFTIKLFGNV